MTLRRPLVAGNWKMHKTGAEARGYARSLRELLADGDGRVQVAVCPPFTALDAAVVAFAGSGVEVFAQAVHEADAGAHTGEIATGMILGTGATGTLVGHSERRAAAETDLQVARRTRAALDAGLSVILCVGESLDRRDAGETEAWLTAQLRAALPGLGGREDALSIAYEPIWAIGTGRTATPESAQAAIAHVRRVAGEQLDAERVRVLYGGSVNADNAAALMAQPDIDGALVGGASLDPESFAAIVRAA